DHEYDVRANLYGRIDPRVKSMVLCLSASRRGARATQPSTRSHRASRAPVGAIAAASCAAACTARLAMVVLLGCAGVSTRPEAASIDALPSREVAPDERERLDAFVARAVDAIVQ